ncbi:MAG: putative baseplate assembly protein [Anaerolineae bacterium]|jgi:hypothetical protein
MNNATLTCQDERRRQAVRRHEDYNGLDYLEVSDDQLKLTVYFLEKAPEELREENVRITGGRRIRDIEVVDLQLCQHLDPDLDDCVVVTVDKPGDFSTYELCLVDLDEYGRPTGRPFPGLDPRYACLPFSFKVGCPSDLDCKPQVICPPEERAEPEINYLAKDYASFRRLILDRLSLLMPDWQERHVPDLGVTLAEVLAYVGDHLSYYQDAVATEAYLGTARQRISARRHARLVDYEMHEGCNARAWVTVETEDNLRLKPHEFYFVTGHNEVFPADKRLLDEQDLGKIPRDQYEVFEPLIENRRQPIRFRAAHSRIRFYTWGDRQCCLPTGATQATLRDGWVKPTEEPKRKDKEYPQEAQQQKPPEKGPAARSGDSRRRKLDLKPGDVLIFEEVKGPGTGNTADADPGHRHAVRLTKVEPAIDPLFNRPIVEIEWAEEDALPFPLCISVIGPAPECEMLEDVSVARGNVLLVDHGRRVDDEDLGCVPLERADMTCEGVRQPSDPILVPGSFRPHLRHSRLTFSEPLKEEAPASSLLTQDPRRALPWIRLTSTPDPSCGDEPEAKPMQEPPAGAAEQEPYEKPAPASQDASSDSDPVLVMRWVPRRDLLSSSRSDPHFVVEMDNQGRAHLRFGDGELGRVPHAGNRYRATYRVGVGPAGNVGAEAISHVVTRDSLSGTDLRPRNPLPAQGGTAPEPLALVKLSAPHAFRRELQRAVTAEDYASIVMRDFGVQVQRAAAVLRWTGSWYEVLVAVDPREEVRADQALLRRIAGHLYRYRRMGHDVVVKLAQYVPLDIEMMVCVQPHTLRGHVKAALLDLFSNRRLPDSTRGFFHPDSLTFGEGIMLSKMVAVAQAVPGVESVTVTKLERAFEGPNREIEDGVLPLGPFEVARVDNDPSFPEHGTLKLTVRGGR